MQADLSYEDEKYFVSLKKNKLSLQLTETRWVPTVNVEFLHETHLVKLIKLDSTGSVLFSRTQRRTAYHYIKQKKKRNKCHRTKRHHMYNMSFSGTLTGWSRGKENLDWKLERYIAITKLAEELEIDNSNRNNEIVQ
jgi:hypothetical protein